MTRDLEAPPTHRLTGWRARWPIWAVHAALVWSVGYGGLALVWALGGPGFPFGAGDIEGADMGSLLFAAPARLTGSIFSGSCLAGAAVALAMVRPTGNRALRRTVSTVAWLLAVALIVILPDIRVLQNAAYVLLLVFAKIDWTLLNQGLLVVGGVVWAAAAAGYQHRERVATPHRDLVDGTDGRFGRTPRSGEIATYVAFLMPLPYGITRLAWALGVPLGLDQDLAGAPVGDRIGESALALLAIGGGILTLGLIRPWGEVWPRWVPVLAGRKVPVALPTSLAAAAAVLVTVGGFAFLRLVIMDELGVLPAPAMASDSSGWGASGPGWLFPIWGVALGMAALAYARRRVRGARAE